MKKPRRSTPYDEQPDPMHDIDIELDSQDDEIIDLEDIIEMPARSIDEDEDLDLDVEILDADSDLDPEAREQPANKAGRAYEDDASRAERTREEEELIKSLGDEMEEDEGLFEAVAPREPARKPAEPEETPIFDEEDESLFAELMNETRIEEAPIPEGVERNGKIDLRERTLSAMKIDDETSAQPAPAVSTEPFDSPPAKPAPKMAPAPAPAPAPAAPPAAVDDRVVAKAAEELIGRLEESLLENVRMIVEMMLPDLVRSIIAEEIEKLKKEGK